MTHGIARIRLDDGTPVWARVSAAEELERDTGFQDTGIGRVGDRVVSMAGGLSDVVRGVVGSLRAGIDPQSPVEVAVTFGIELSAQAGKVIGVLADAGGKASVNVSLTWTEPGPAPTEPPPASAAPTVPAPTASPENTAGNTSGAASANAQENAQANAPDTGPLRPPAADGTA